MTNHKSAEIRFQPGDLVIEEFSTVIFYYLVKNATRTKIYTYFCIHTNKSGNINEVIMSRNDVLDLFGVEAVKTKILRIK